MSIKRAEEKIYEIEEITDWFKVNKFYTKNKRIIIFSAIIQHQPNGPISSRLKSVTDFIKGANVIIKKSYKIKTNNTTFAKYIIWEENYE